MGFSPKIKGAGILLAAVLIGSSVSGCVGATAEVDYHRPDKVTDAEDALKLLKAGNRRFKRDNPEAIDQSLARRKKLADEGQHPFAVVITCSDSRVPPELLFDQGVGDLFIIRVAGNVIDPVALGSVEYAIEHLKAPLVVVLGHSSCGAVTATVEGGEVPGSIGSIVEMIAPALEKAQSTGVEEDELVDATISENVLSGVRVVESSPVFRELAEKGKVAVISATYDIESGETEFGNLVGAED